MIKEYNKLVRDKIPFICENNGDIPTYRTLDEDEYKKYLELKFYEELEEVINTTVEKKEELADLLEDIISYANLYGITLDDIVKAQEEKHEKRGGFSKRILLISTERNDK